MLFDPVENLQTVRGVNNEQIGIIEPVDEDVVKNAARFVGYQRVANLADFDGRDVVGDD